MSDTRKADTTTDSDVRPDADVMQPEQSSGTRLPDEETHPADSAEASSEAIEDAEVIEEIDGPAKTASDEPVDVLVSEDDAPADAREEVPPVTEEDETEIADLAKLDGEAPPAADAVVLPEPPEKPAAFDPPRWSEPRESAPEKAPERVIVERRGGLVPGFIGGAIAAAGLLFAAPYVIPPKYQPQNPEVRQMLSEQAQAIAALEADLKTAGEKLSQTALSSDVDAVKTASEQGFADLSSAMGTTKAALDDLGAKIGSGAALGDASAKIDALVARMDSIEKRPLAGTADPAAIAALDAYGREMAELRSAVGKQMSDVDALVKTATASAEQAVSTAKETSDAAVADAEAKAEAARQEVVQVARAQALMDIRTALDEGRGYADVLPKLDGVTIPDDLKAAADSGVSTLADLQKEFTVAARQALSVSRSEASSGSPADRASTWIQNQLGVRSLIPSEGDDPDSVLSRADAAVADARLNDAISELSSLPAGGQQVMADWIAQASARAKALDAANQLAANLAAN